MCGEDISERDILPRFFLRGGAVSSFCPLGRAVFPDNFLYLCTMRRIIAYKNYFSDFIKKLSTDEINKIRRALDLFKVEDKMPRHFIKFIRDGIYEFRVNYGNNEFRIFFI